MNSMTDSENTGGSGKPDLHRRLFWDTRYEDIDWQAAYRTIIARVVERGTNEEIGELVRFYGKDKVVYALKNEIVYLPDYVEEIVEEYFGIKREELACYGRKRSRGGHWI